MLADAMRPSMIPTRGEHPYDGPVDHSTEPQRPLVEAIERGECGRSFSPPEGTIQATTNKPTASARGWMTLNSLLRGWPAAPARRPRRL